MRLLPREQKEALARIPSLIEECVGGKIIELTEPCDCGSHIRHNNGGNYHEIRQIAHDEGVFYVRDRTTYEDSEWGHWCESTVAQVEDLLKACLREGWRVEVR